MDIVTLVLFTANLYFALVQGLRFAQTGSLLTLGVGLVNALACVALMYGPYQKAKAQKEWEKMVRKPMKDWDHMDT